MAGKTKLTYAQVGDTVHWRDDGYDVCRPAIVTGVVGGRLEMVRAEVVGDPEGTAYGERGMEHSTGGHRGTWHTKEECPYPPTVEDE